MLASQAQFGISPSVNTSHYLSFCRVKLKEGITFLGARPSNPTQWIVSQDVRSEGHRVVTLHCRRKESSYDLQRSAGNLLAFNRKLDVFNALCSAPSAFRKRKKCSSNIWKHLVEIKWYEGGKIAIKYELLRQSLE